MLRDSVVVAVVAVIASGIVELGLEQRQGEMVRVSAATTGPAIPAGFVGLSMELARTGELRRHESSLANRVFVQELKNLRGQRPH